MKNKNLLIIIAITAVVIGLIVLAYTMYAFYSAQYVVFAEGELNPMVTSQFGDFIGGVVGSLWTLASVILFFLAIRLQTRELVNQLEVLKSQASVLSDQRREFEFQRIQDLIFHQISRIDSFRNEFSIVNFSEVSQTGSVHEGIKALRFLMKNLNQNINYLDGDVLHVNSNIKDLVERNFHSILELTEVLNSGSATIEKNMIVSDLNKTDKSNLQSIFRDNLGEIIINTFSKIEIVLEMMPIQEDEQNDFRKLRAQISSFIIAINRDY